MAASHILQLALVILLIIGVSCSDNGDQVRQECREDDQVGQCEQYIGREGPKTDPSEGCCSAIKKTDIPCLCKNVDEYDEGTFSMEKVVYIVGKCGKALPSGSKCGSYTVP